MLKTVTGLPTALFVAGFSPAYAQDSSSPIPSQTDFKALTDARIGIVKAALQLTPEQEKLWPPVEEAIRARADARYQRKNNGAVSRVRLILLHSCVTGPMPWLQKPLRSKS
jgi:hypothetical protein